MNRKAVRLNKNSLNVAVLIHKVNDTRINPHVKNGAKIMETYGTKMFPWYKNHAIDSLRKTAIKKQLPKKQQ